MSPVQYSSEQINELAAALAKAQAKIPNATLNKLNPHFKSKYADLAGIRDAVLEPLTEQGLSYSQCSRIVSGVNGEPLYIIWRTTLMHISGQWLASEWPIPYTPDKPQTMGSNTTYARRYTLSAVTGIASEEDDDANEAAKPNRKAKKAVTLSPEESATVTAEMLEQIEQLQPEQVDDYAKTNAGTYGRLMAEHQDTVKKACNLRRATAGEGGNA